MKGVHVCVAAAASVLVLAVLAGAQSERPPASGAAKRFVGMWRLVSFELGNEEAARARGAHPTGLIVYDASGFMSAQIMPDRARGRFSGPASSAFTGPQPTPVEALDAISGYTAYFGTYTVDEGAGTVTHHRHGNVNPGAPADVVRRFAFVGEDRLSLIPLETENSRLLWERVNRGMIRP